MTESRINVVFRSAEGINVVFRSAEERSFAAAKRDVTRPTLLMQGVSARLNPQMAITETIRIDRHEQPMQANLPDGASLDSLIAPSPRHNH